jgi:hypothetical protein
MLEPNIGDCSPRLPRRTPFEDLLPSVPGAHGLTKYVEILIVIYAIVRR